MPIKGVTKKKTIVKSRKMKVYFNEEVPDQPFPELTNYEDIQYRPKKLADIKQSEGQKLTGIEEGATKNTGALADLDQVDTAQIVDRAVSNVKIALNAIQGDVIAAGAITETKISNNAISTPKLQAGCIIASKIGTGEVTAEKINVSELSAISANIGSVTAGNITGVNITASRIKTAASGNRLEIREGSAGYAHYILWFKNNTDIGAWIIGTTGGALLVHADDHVEFSTTITPEATGTRNLGATNLKWNVAFLKQIYLGAGVQITTDTEGTYLIPVSDGAYNLGATNYRWNYFYTRYLDVSHGVQSNLIPTSTYNLGSSTYKWGNLFLSGTIGASGSYIDDIYLGAGKEIYVGSTTHYIRLNQRDYSTHDAAGFDHLGDINPEGSGIWDLGRDVNKWNLYYGGTTACDLPTYNSALKIFKKIKVPKIKTGHFGKRQYFDEDEFPSEFKYKDKRSGKEVIEGFHTLGACVQAIRELNEKVEKLEKKIK